MGESDIALDLCWVGLEGILVGLVERIYADGVPQLVVGILRGGMIPAVMLAHRLGVRSVRGVEIAHTLTEDTNSAKTSAPEVTNPGSLGQISGDVLVVDDVAGSGATADLAAGMLGAHVGRVRRAVVVVNTINWAGANTAAPHEVHDYIGTTCAGWVRFPWEVR